MTLLAQYCPSPENEAAFDESIQKAQDRLNVRAPEIESPVLRRLLDVLTAEEPAHVILTGTAGDGKTHICRQVYHELVGDRRKWGDPIVRGRLPQGRDLVIVKDFTELGLDQQIKIVAQLSSLLFSGEPANEVLLIAANEGILTHRTNLRELGDEGQRKLEEFRGKKEWLKRLHMVLNDLLIYGLESRKSIPLHLFNLSCIPATENLARVLHAVLYHEAWGLCQECDLARTEGDHWCPVYENLMRLRRKTVQRRLTQLVEICEYTGEHLTIRHLLMMVSNALVGHALASGPVKAVVSCEHVRGLLGSDLTSMAYFQNIFGANLPRAAKIPPFSVLSSLGVGEETNNRIDDLLVYGDLDEDIAEDYLSAIGSDRRFGLTSRFCEMREQYREESPEDNGAAFLAALVAQRRRLYFEMPEELEERYRYKDLTVYRSAQEYRAEIIEPLNAGRPISEEVLNRLVIGLNRVFVGALTQDTQCILLATSGTTSQARVCDLLIHPLSHNPFEGAGLSVQSAKGGEMGYLLPYLGVSFRGQQIARLELSLARYEFLRRVSEGVLPASFSPELYEDALAFKSQIIHKLELRMAEELQRLPIRVLFVKEDGKVQWNPVDTVGDESGAATRL